MSDTGYTCLWGAGDYSQMPDDSLVKLYRDAKTEAQKMAADDAWYVDRIEQGQLVASLLQEIDNRGLDPWESK